MENLNNTMISLNERIQIHFEIDNILREWSDYKCPLMEKKVESYLQKSLYMKMYAELSNGLRWQLNFFFLSKHNDRYTKIN